ncbi:hypothetical protein P3X46_024541 [Hevea brasiliensis]|uniref:TIR domain-containing protein n=1 Tax=Hevea brasiliensis TaxID=3981 RepID=A0ABQ9L4J7_HEVBR|nr:disease resistance protein RPV1 isoform X2 [Hevea brasiliensis]KAJ9159005.1 hypothetical protein P3X46_024541 [Hevea brasiliensis]
MASSSSSTTPCKYDVFISFRGKDIHSPWCLDELVKILECKETLGQMVLPVFYEVDPTDVQEPRGKFKEAFDIAKRGEQVKGSLQKVDKWKHALMEVSNLSGWDSRDKYESKLVEEIVNDVLKKLSHMSKSDDSYDGNLIGIESRVEKVERLLNDKQVVGIWGMGGIGKTTIAKEVFHRNKNKFDACHFVDKQPLCEEALNSRSKIFTVYDDVNDPIRLKSLAKKWDSYGEGSRIIVTSRDLQVLKNVCSSECIYEVEQLCNSEDLELFSLHAFKQNNPKEGFVELSKKVITYAGGNPLALIVLGSHLFDMEIEEWKSELENLKGQSLKNIQDVLRISYDGLERNEKKIFLDIACFFKWNPKDDVQKMLKACGFFPEGPIRRLINKSLMSTTFDVVYMHDLIEQMGKDIVNEECEQPGGRSRLWNYEDISHVLTTDTGTENVEAILLNMQNNGKLEVSSTAFMKMCNLRFLKVGDDSTVGEVLLPNSLEFLPQKLRYLYWINYPLESLPLEFWPKNLVQLHMPFSNLRQLWDEDKPLGNLKLMDLSNSIYLTRIPNLSSVAPNLEFLYLEACLSLVEIPSLQNLSKLTVLNLCWCLEVTDSPEVPCNIRILTLDGTAIEQLPSSIEHLSQLVKLSLNECIEVVSLPSGICKLKHLEELSLYECSSLVSIPSSIGELKCLKELCLDECSNLTSLPESIKQLPKLKRLNLRDCKSLRCLPELPSCLEYLHASDCISLESASTSFLFLEHEDESEEADESEAADENEDADICERKDFCKDCKLLDFGNCVNLDKNKVMEDVLKAHLLGQKVILYIEGGEVPEGMSYKNKSGSSLSFRLNRRHLIAFSFCVVLHPTEYYRNPDSIKCRVDFIDESGYRHSRDLFLYYYGGLDEDDDLDFKDSPEHVLLSFSDNKFGYVDEECFIEASFQFSIADAVELITECGVHPIYSRNKKRSRNEEHLDDEEHQRPLQILREEE